MSEDIKVSVGYASSQCPGYTIQSMHGCRVVFGAVPLRDVSILNHGFSKKAVMAIDIADRLGASFVVGEPDDIEALRKADLPVSEKRQRDYAEAFETGNHQLAMWLRNGERGASSNAMATRIFGIPEDHAGIEHPCDPDDLRRCLLFLSATDAHDKVPLMRGLSPEWARLAEKWGDIVAMYREESAAGKTAPRTYALMRSAIEGSKEATSC